MTHSNKVLAGRYRLIRQLGQGGMGSVWMAEHLSLRSPIAVKLIDAQIAYNPEALSRFMREAQASASLRSPNVVQVFDYGVDEGVPFIAMELLEGESLGARLTRLAHMAIEDVSRIFTQVARAITRAHEAGIIHRDLKPDNIFLVGNYDEEVAKVLDFGIAKTHFALNAGGFEGTRTGTMLGTPYYMSPEQAQGLKDIDYRTDIWSLGVIAFECILGSRPFDGDTLGGLIMSICARPIVVPSTMGTVPPGFDGWFAKSTARDKSDRFLSATEQAAALRAICSESRQLSPHSIDVNGITAPFEKSPNVLTNTRTQPDSLTFGGVARPPVDLAQGRAKSIAVVAPNADSTKSPDLDEADSGVLLSHRIRRKYVAFAAIATVAALVGALALYVRSRESVLALRPVASASVIASVNSSAALPRVTPTTVAPERALDISLPAAATQSLLKVTCTCDCEQGDAECSSRCSLKGCKVRARDTSQPQLARSDMGAARAPIANGLAISGNLESAKAARDALKRKTSAGTATDRERRLLRALCRQLGDSSCS